jgi:eukaryotic-like serine/threonine-protein kinase
MHVGDVMAERFVLLERAGAGGMGTVFRAEDRETGLPVAVKVLHGRRREDTQRFEREAQLLSALRHPRIVRHVAHGVTQEGDPWLSMEWLPGEDLCARLKRGPLRIDESVALASAMAEGLGFAHGLSVIHRDLKPGNVFLVDGQVERATLLDFGVAWGDGGARITRTGTLLGTPGYMAPEQARGQRVSAQADVYSLGCVLYECLAGEPLVAGEHFVARLVKTLFDETPRMRVRLRGSPEALCDLLERTLSKDAAARPRDGAEVAEALSRLGPLPQAVVSLAPASVRAGRALTDIEQRSVAVLLVGAGDEGDPALDETLCAEAKRHGGHCEALQDGTLTVVLTGVTPLPTDLSAQAARCALSLRARAPGRPFVLSMGRVERTDRLPMGQVIDRAARLLEGRSAGSGSVEAAQVVLDDVVAGLLDGRFDVRESAGAFVLCSEHELAEGTRTLLGKATPCVGREREIRQLERLFEDCVEEGTAQVVLVTAPAGTGKSRLGQEFLRALRDRTERTPVWIGRGDSLRAGSPLGLLSQALRGACGVLEGEPLDMRRDKVLASAERVAEKERRRVAAFLGEIIGAPFADEDDPPLRAARGDAQLMGTQMRAAFIDFIAGTCTAGPLLILIEDMHWGDRASAQFLDQALKDLEESPLFVLVLSRPEVDEVFPNLWSQRGRQDIRLQELPKKAVERLARHVLGDRAGLETIERLAKLSEGNAFYLEELLRWAAEGKSGELPDTVVAMVQARLAALDDESRRVLRAASVFGEVFWPGAVAALLGGAERTSWVRDKLGTLHKRELLVKLKNSRFPGEDEFVFRHALLREGAYTMLTAEDLALGHKLAGEWLERHGEQDAVLLAEHFQKGGGRERAAHHYLRAVEQSLRGGDFTATLTYAQRGLQCHPPDELRLALLGAFCQASYARLERVMDARSQAQELCELAPPGSAPFCQGMLVLLACALRARDLEAFNTTFRRLLPVDPSPDAVGKFSLAISLGTYMLDLFGRIAEADRAHDRLTQIMGGLGDRAPVASTWWHLACGFRWRYAGEDPWRALSHAEAAMAVTESIGHQSNRRIAELFVHLNRWHLGGLGVDRSLKELPLADEGLGFASPVRPFVLTWMLADGGALEEARQWAERLITSGQSRRLPMDEGVGHWAMAEVLLRAGELDTAEREVKAALGLLKAAAPINVPGALATLAALRLAQGRPAEGVAAAEEGLDRYASMGACSLFMRGAFLRLAHAECLAGAGEHEKACAAIAEARRCVLANAGKIGDPAYRTSFLENVPEHRRTLELARRWLGDEA